MNVWAPFDLAWASSRSIYAKPVVDRFVAHGQVVVVSPLDCGLSGRGLLGRGLLDGALPSRGLLRDGLLRRLVQRRTGRR